MIGNLNNPDFHPLTLANRKLPECLYAGDTVLLSRTPVGLRTAIEVFSLLCDENQLVMLSKTKNHVLWEGT